MGSPPIHSYDTTGEEVEVVGWARDVSGVSTVTVEYRTGPMGVVLEEVELGPDGAFNLAISIPLDSRACWA